MALLDKVKAAVGAPGDGRALVKLWDESAPKLASVAEAKTYELAASGWRARIKAADDFLRAFAKVPQAEKELAEAWGAVTAAGPLHPRLTDAHRKRGEDARRWWPALDKLRRVPTAATHENDTKLLAAWGSGTALAGCAEAVPFAPRAADARARVNLVDALERAIRQAEQGGPEDAVVAAAAMLPAGYPHPYMTRVGEGAEGLRLLTDIQKALDEPQPLARAVAVAFDALKLKNPKLAARLDRMNPMLFAKIEHAIRRRELLDRFARIDAELSRADRQDVTWLTLWAERGKELAERDREELRARLTLARERTEKWGKVAEALKARDMFALREQFAAHGAALRGYPPLVKQTAEILELLKKADRVIAIRQQVGAAATLTADDLAFLRLNHDAFDAGTKAAVVAQVEARLAGDARLVPAYPAYSVSGKRNRVVKACWAWGGHGLISHCVLAIDGRRFLDKPGEAEPYSRANCQPDTHQREGGGFTLVPPGGAEQAYVTIWPVVELGWTTIQGPPLKIGPVPLGAASATGTRW